MPEGGPARPARRHQGLTGPPRLYIDRDRARPPARRVRRAPQVTRGRCLRHRTEDLGAAGKHQEHDEPAVWRRPYHDGAGDLAVSIQPADDLIDHGREQLLVGAGFMCRSARACGARPATTAKLPTRPRTASAMHSSLVGPHASIRRSAGCNTLRCPRSVPSCGLAVRCVMAIGFLHTAPRQAVKPLRPQHAAHDPAVTIAGAGPEHQGPWSQPPPAAAAAFGLPRPTCKAVR